MKEFLWKYGLIIFLMISMSVLAFQKEANEGKILIEQSKMVPDQTVVISAILRPGKGMPVIILKGLLNPENEGEKWLTLENFKKLVNPKIDSINTFEANKGKGK